MSQIYKSIASGPIPPTIVQTFTTDDGPPAVVPDGVGNVNVFGDNGIVTSGQGPGSTITISLEQRTECGGGTTVGAVTADIITIPLGALAATYSFDALIAGKADTADGIGGNLLGSFKTNGAAASVLDVVDQIYNADLALQTTGDFEFVASGGDVILRVTGVAGFTIEWFACTSITSVVAGV